MKNANRPTEEQAVEFDGYVAKWQHVLNLCDWRIERGARSAKNAMADIGFDDTARLAVYRLGDFGAEDITPLSLEKTALHEMLHVLLHDLLTTAQDPKSLDEDIQKQEHRVINLLENLLTKDVNGRT